MLLLTFLFYTEFTSNGLLYSVRDDGAYVEGFSGAIIENLNIPSQVQSDIGTFNVVKTCEHSFEGNISIKTVKIGANIRIIGENSFFQATGITSITFESNSNLEIIEVCGFDRLFDLVEFNLPNRVHTICEYALSSNRVVTWNIPSSVTLIKPGALTHLYACSEFVVAQENPNYCSVDGALYTKDLKMLLAIPCKDYVRIGDTVEIIDTNALMNYGTNSVHLPFMLKEVRNSYDASQISRVSYCGPKVFNQNIFAANKVNRIVTVKFAKYDTNFGLIVDKSLDDCPINADIFMFHHSHRNTGRWSFCFYLPLNED